MTAEHDTRSYAVGILTEVMVGDAVREYLERIDATLEPFGGRFLIHGAPAVVHEGVDPGAVIVIEFPSASGAIDWYRSEDYRAIIELRAVNSTSTIFTIGGVPPGHVATDVLVGR